jgi:2-C-methyl-D-erythritol 4-phosphate cytidylyltransferase
MTVLPSFLVSNFDDQKIWTIIVAGGEGRRFGRPKQFESLGDERVLDRSVRVARSVSDGVVIVVPEEDAEREGGVPGGDSRSDSVRRGLEAVPSDATVVCVHDAARPFASALLYEGVIAAVVSGADGAVPGVALTDTIKRVDVGRSTDGVLGAPVVETPDRSTLVAVQTPQAFRAEALRAAHARGGEATDDAALVEQLGHRVVVVPGEVRNRKITQPVDLDWARDEAARETAAIEART